MHLCYAFLFSTTRRLCISSLFYTEPRQYCSSPFIALTLLCCTIRFHCKTFHRHSNALRLHSMLRQRSTLLYFTFPLPRYAKLLFTVPTRILSLLCLCNTHHRLAGLFRRIAFLSYASPKQINAYPFHTFALPIITTISHTVAYSVISVHLKRPLPEFRH